MAKLTTNQLLYRKQINRIRRILSTLRSEGYDVSDLATQYTSALPKRVTQKTLSDLQSLTSKKLRKEVANRFVGLRPQKGTPLSAPYTTYTETPKIKHTNESMLDYQSAQHFEEFMPAPVATAISPFMDAPIEPETVTERPTPVEYTDPTSPEFYFDPNEQYETDTEEELPTYDVNKGEAYEYQADGTVEVHPLYIEENDYNDTVTYIDGETGEILDVQPRTISTTPDLSEMAIEELRMIANGFSDTFSKNFNDAIDKMIQQKGIQSVAEAFIQSLENHPNMLERLSNVKEKYHAVRELFGEMIEKLDMDIKVRDLMRNEITRDSMADMEDYL